MPKYIFVTGAPGSKWCSVVNSIYHSADIDRGDYSDARTYRHNLSGQMELAHQGAYFDPGMEFGDWFAELDANTKAMCEAEFDRPWAGHALGGIKIIKSHMFAAQLDFLRETWPDCPVVLVHRSEDACLGQWVRCGEFRITYPKYTYYNNLDNMAWHIDYQNNGILNAAARADAEFDIVDNHHLCQRLGIKTPTDHWQNYPRSDVKVAVLK